MFSGNPLRARRWLVSFAALSIILIITSSIYVHAQVSGATLVGAVTDASGGVIPNAQVSIKNTATGVVRDIASDAAGRYLAPNLLPGRYEITVSVPGFATQIRSGITLTVGEQQVLDMTMQVGQTAETVEVTGEAPSVELASSTLGNVVMSNTVVELPLNGRDWAQLATLQSGVNTVQTQVALTGTGGPRGNRGFGAQLTISGTRPQMNNYRLDGISIVDYSGGSPGSVLGITMGVDAIGEFSVLTSNYSAEYGRTAGGVINAVTRSGSNPFHGDLYSFIRDEGFDARNFFDTTIPPFHRTQFGASAGGPIRKDKTFFFANYEGFLQSLGATSPNNVPTQDARNGIIYNANGTSCTIGVVSPGCALTNSAGTVGVDPKIIPYLAFWPLPSVSAGTSNVGTYNSTTITAGHENFVTSRIDHNISKNDILSGTWFYDRASVSNPDALNEVLNANTSIRLMATVAETHIFSPTLTNSLRIGYSRIHTTQNVPIRALNPLAADTALGILPGRPAPALTVTGITSFIGGLDAPSYNNQRWNSYQVYDDAFLTRGNHSIKFGFVVENMRHGAQNRIAKNGAFTFGSVLDFLLNKPLALGGPGVPLVPIIHQTLFGGYVQDDWRIRPNLTLNLGLRYEASTVPTEAHNEISNLRNITDSGPTLGAPYFMNPTLRNFEPRVGFSWDPFRNGKTAIRGAFGLFDVLPLIGTFFTAMQNVTPFTDTISAGGLSQGDFPGKLTTLLNTGGGNHAFQYQSFEFKPRRNYVMIWNLNVQRQLTQNLTMTVGYVGNHGVHMQDRDGYGNDVLPVSTANGMFLWPIDPITGKVGSGTQINPNISGQVEVMRWQGDALYDALQVTVLKTFSHGFQAQGSYTWGKNIDTGSASSISDPYSNSLPVSFWWCRSCRRGLADFDVAQNLTINYMWTLPTAKNWGSASSYVLGGWSIGGILTARTGVPFTPLISGDPLGLMNGKPLGFPDRLKGPGCETAVNPGNVNNYIKLNCFTLPVSTAAIAAQCQPFIGNGTLANPQFPGTCSNRLGNVGRNSVIGPGLMDFDFSVFKNNYIKKISETFNIQFRAELFNVLNHPNFETPYDTNALFGASGVPIGNAGKLLHVATTSRQIQFGLKMLW